MTIGIEHANDYPLIRFDIRFERKFPIRRSLQIRCRISKQRCLIPRWRCRICDLAGSGWI